MLKNPIKRLNQGTVFGIVLLISSLVPHTATAENISDDGFSVSVNYQGVGVQYGWGKYSLEGRFQYHRETEDKDESKTRLFGLRVNRYGNTPSPGLSWYGGGELNTFSFENSVVQSDVDGFIFGVYAGVRKFMGRRLAITCDAGPYFASAATQTGTSNRSDIVLNSSVELHWGGSQP